MLKHLNSKNKVEIAKKKALNATWKKPHSFERQPIEKVYKW